MAAAPQPTTLKVFALDVGVPPVPSGRGSRLGWAGPGKPGGTPGGQTGDTLCGLVTDVQAALVKGPVHLYLEAPLFLPGDPQAKACQEAHLCAMRPFEHAGGLPPWVAGTT